MKRAYGIKVKTHSHQRTLIPRSRVQRLLEIAMANVVPVIAANAQWIGYLIDKLSLITGGIVLNKTVCYNSSEIKNHWESFL